MAKRSTGNRTARPAANHHNSEAGTVNFSSGRERLMELPLALIDSNPDQPRKRFGEAALEELAQSIRAMGLLVPVTVRSHSGGRFLLISGERRTRAARMAGLEAIPALLTEREDIDEIAIVENMHRVDLNPLEEAQALFKLKEQAGYTEAKLGEILGVSPSAVSMSLAINRLPESVKAEMGELQNSEFPPKSLIYEMVRNKDADEMYEAWESYKNGDFNFQTAKKQRAANNKARIRPDDFKLKADTFTLTLKFKHVGVSEKRIVETLETAVRLTREKFGLEK